MHDTEDKQWWVIEWAKKEQLFVTQVCPKLGLIATLSVLVGGMLAAAVVYILESLDRRVRSRADLESRLAVPSFGRLSRWQPTGGRLLPVPLRTARALPHPW